MLSNDHWLLPEGIEEILPDDAARLEALRRRVLDLFQTWGYRLVVTPFIEFIDSLLTGTGHDLDVETFKLIDQMSGRTLGVRADMTPQVARIDARHSNPELPARLCYLGTVLHTVSDRLETSRSPMQVGAELYGHAGLSSDVEIICLALEMLALAGLQNIHLDLGHVGIYRALAAEAQLDAIAERELFEILQCKAKPELAEMIASLGIDQGPSQRLAGLIDLNGGFEVFDLARRHLQGSGPAVLEALNELEQIATVLSMKFPNLPIHFDLAELRGYHYQTGIVFAAFVTGYGREVARGGRYNGIGKVFGRERPATGFSADLRVLLRLSVLDWAGPADMGAIFAPAVEDATLDECVRDLRARNRVVIRELTGQADGPAAMGCIQQLEKLDGIWRLVPVPATPTGFGT
jgi:ATP phosphoribosyltransferase regulatory subunit